MQKTIMRKSEVVALNDDEILIFQLVANEKSREEIAEVFDKSIRTIEGKIYKVLLKTGCKTQEGVIALFMRNKLIK